MPAAALFCELLQGPNTVDSTPFVTSLKEWLSLNGSMTAALATLGGGLGGAPPLLCIDLQQCDLHHFWGEGVQSYSANMR